MIPTGAEDGPPPDSPHRGLARSAGIVGAAVFASRILGLVREQVFAALFGASRELDAFITAFRIPNLFRDLFAEGALSAAFVTCFTKKLEREGDRAAWHLASLVVNALVIVVGALVAVGILAAPWLVDAIAPGFREVPGKTELTVRLTRLLFPFLLLIALAAVAMGMLNAKERFGVAASASSFFNLGSIVAGVALAWWLAPDYLAAAWQDGPAAAAMASPEAVARAILGMALGTLVGGALQFLVQVPSLHRLKFRYRPIVSFSDPGVREVLALMAPATVGAAAVQVNVLVNSNFASYLGDGAVSWLNVAFRFMQLPIGVFGVAVGVVALPAVSRRVAHADAAGFAATVVRALRLVFALCLPSAVGLAVLAPEVIGVVYEHGRFSARDTDMAAQALVAYSIGLAGYANVKVLVPAFYALGDARTPAAVSCLSIAANALLNWITIRKLGYGHVGLALATSAVAILNLVVLFAILRRRIGALPGVGDGLWRTALASAVVGAVCVAVKLGCGAFADAASLSGRLLVLALAIPLGAIAFASAAAILGVPEVTSIAQRIRRRTG
jgi:putative peptidoglycan lipid II flippase